MRVERLVIEAGENTLTLDLHPRLTVVAGMGRVERESLVGELIGALGARAPGCTSRSRSGAVGTWPVFRPTSGRHRIVDVDRARDVTVEFTDPSGGCNLLDQLALDSRAARRLMRFGAADLAASSHRGQAVEVLASLDQRRVWAAADALRRAERDLTSESEAIGSAPEDAAMIEEVEARHIAVEEAAERFETDPQAHLLHRRCAARRSPSRPWAWPAPPGSCSWPSPSSPSPRPSWPAPSVGRAARAEEKALEEAGAHSYLGFQLQRVNGLLANDASRKVLMDVAGARRAALADWQQLAGDIPVEWALANREEIEEASRLRREVDALGSLSPTAPEVAEDVTDDLAHVLVTRLAEVRSAGGEGVPLLLDDPFQRARPVGEAAPARAPRPLGRRAADRLPHRGRGRRLVGPPGSAHRRGRPHRARTGARGAYRRRRRHPI